MPSRVTQATPTGGAVPRLEKIPAAAVRCGVSTAQFYRLAKAGNFKIVKVGERASAVDAAEVDAFIRGRLEAGAKAAPGAMQTSAQGGGHV